MPPLRRCLAVTTLFVATGTSPVAAKEAAAQAPVNTLPDDTISVVATGQVPVERPARPTQATIEVAVANARRRLPAVALREVRRRAVELAYAAGRRVGALRALADLSSPPFFFDQAQGTFGPGRFCGRITRRVGRRPNGRPRLRTRFGCRVPRSASLTVQATYAIDGPLR